MKNVVAVYCWGQRSRRVISAKKEINLLGNTSNDACLLRHQLIYLCLHLCEVQVLLLLNMSIKLTWKVKLERLGWLWRTACHWLGTTPILYTANKKHKFVKNEMYTPRSTWLLLRSQGNFNLLRFYISKLTAFLKGSCTQNSS